MDVLGREGVRYWFCLPCCCEGAVEKDGEEDGWRHLRDGWVGGVSLVACLVAILLEWLASSPLHRMISRTIPAVRVVLGVFVVDSTSDCVARGSCTTICDK